MKGARGLMLLSALAIGGCGGDSIQSPDFTPELIEIIVDPAQAEVAVGDTIELEATGVYTAPPGEEPYEDEVTVTWSVDEEDLASVDENGVVTGLARGTVEVTAAAEGIEATAVIEVVAPVLQAIVIEPSPVTVPLGAEVELQALGVYCDGCEPREIDDGTVVTWVSEDATVASVSPAVSHDTTVTGRSLGATAVTASATNAEGELVTETVDVSVTDAALTAVIAVNPETATIGVGLSQTFVAEGSYSDGTTANIANSDLDWTSGSDAVATIDAMGVATGVGEGTTAITATLKDEVAVGVEDRSADASLEVTGDACLSRLLVSNGATVEVETGPSLLLCLGCLVDDEANIIDDDFENFAKVIVPVGLLNGYVSTTVAVAEGETLDAGTQPGFVIARPANALLSAELLSQLTVSTLLDGEVQESSDEMTPLRLTLLGLLGDDQLVLATLPDPATLPYDAVQLTFTSGLASALSSTDVYAACSATDLVGETE